MFLPKKQNRMTSAKDITKIKRVTFLRHSVQCTHACQHPSLRQKSLNSPADVGPADGTVAESGRALVTGD